MGINVTNIERIRHTQAGGLVEYRVHLHYGDGGVDTVSPWIDSMAETALRQAAYSPALFDPLAASTWGAWWASLPGLALPQGSPPWRVVVRQDYAAPL